MADTARSSTVLKTYFETGDIPTQQQFADWLTSYQNVVDNNFLNGSSLTLSAHAGGGQGSATPAPSLLNIVTVCASNHDSVIVPNALPGTSGLIFNNTNQILDVYPASGESFFFFGSNVPYSLPPFYSLVYNCVDSSSYIAKAQTRAGLPSPYSLVQASVTSLSPNLFLYTDYYLTAQGTGLTLGLPSGMFGDGSPLRFTIKDNGSSQSLTWTSVYVALSNALPTATIAGKQMFVSFIYNKTIAKWLCTNVSIEGQSNVAYQSYVATVTQIGSSAPTATVFNNTLSGPIVWTRNSAGDFTGTLAGAFTANKTFLMLNGANNADSIGTLTFGGSADTLALTCVDFGGTPVDGGLIKASIEIRVYP